MYVGINWLYVVVVLPVYGFISKHQYYGSVRPLKMAQMWRNVEVAILWFYFTQVMYIVGK